MRQDKHTLALISLLFLYLPSIASSESHRVPLQFPTIQSAINAAKMGDTVLVDEGLYYENIRINKNIVVASWFIADGDRSHIERTVINGSKAKDLSLGSTVTIREGTDSTCAVLGFTITGGSGTYIFAQDDVIGEHWIGGGGVILKDAGGRIAYNIICENVIDPPDSGYFSFGGGIAAEYTSIKKRLPPSVIIEQNIVHNNKCRGVYAEAAGMWVGQPGIVRHNVVMFNYLRSERRNPGGGIYVAMMDEYDIRVEANYVTHNRAGIGGGILVTSAFIRRGRAIFTNNIIAENEALEVGGAANIAEEAYAIFVNNTIVHNKGLASGGGINVTYGAHATLVNNILWNNAADQVSIWGNLQAYNNLSEGGLPGKGNISVDPRFLPGDSLFRLSPESPCIGTGAPTLRILAKEFSMPQKDFLDSLRSLPQGSMPDIGALESPWSHTASSDRILEDQSASVQSHVKLTMFLRQITPTERTSVSREIISAGKIATTIVVNDTAMTSIHTEVPPLSFTLPPGQNLLEVEIVARARDSSEGLNVYYHLKGADPQVRILRRKSSYLYYSYSDLKPGNYQLIIQPQDESMIIGYTNRFSINIAILPYWYQRWWAYVLFAITVLGISSGLYRMRLKRVLLEQRLTNEHLQSEKLNELSQLKSRFLANVSHELRTPLSLITGPVERLLENESNEQEKEQLGLIHRNAQRLMRLIELLLQYSRLESGTIKLRVAHEDILPILRRITGYFSSPASKKHIDLRFTTGQERLTGWIDTEKVEHILQNCISNAIKFTSEGGTIEVCAGMERDHLVLTVTDTGEGIAPEHLPHVFDRFYRVDTTHKTEGTGIGLSLSKELAEIHHGSIQLASKLGKGTVATIRIPLSGYSAKETDTMREILPPVQDQLQVESLRGAADISREADERPIILVAEDNEDARIFIRSQLSRHHQIIEATDGEQALHKTKFQIPDLVISDVMMPKLDGRELCTALKQDERTCHIPVILLTALSEKEDRIKGLNTGADDYLVKPFDAVELQIRVRNLLENRKKLREAFGKTVPLKPGEISMPSLDDVFLGKAISIVTAHMADEGFGVETFAREIFLSRTQLQRKIKAITNLPPSDFIRHLRLQRAKELLEVHTGSISEIADSVGFTNHSYFAKCFQEQFGILPNQVRNHQK
ncbi:MAG: ATP-binding protein [Bacteroidota bacterium]